MGESPPVLAGREPIIDRFYLDLEQVGEGGTARETALYGLRGMGKTALLGELVRAARQAEWLAVRVEAESEEGSLVSTIAGGVARPRVVPAGWDQGSFLDRFGEFAARAGIRVTGLGGVDASVRVKPKVSDVRPADVLVDLYQELGRIAIDQRRGIAILIDETQRASVDDLRGLFRAVSEAKTEQLPVITAFAGLLETPELLMSAATSAERVLFEEIGVLDPAATYRALRTPADRAGVIFDDDALDLLIEFSEGYPYFIQQLGSDVWNVRSDPDRITIDDAEIAIVLARRQFERGALGRRWVELPEWGRHVVAAISMLADYPSQWVEVGKVAELVGKTTTELSMTRRRLSDRGAVQTERGQIRITQPGFHWYAAGLVERGEIDLEIG
ncbi:MAG: AAA family ATPase [Acidimicrobiia bacterium]|nr:AAA family ATPase [Acidimicrobiia bacterium]